VGFGEQARIAIVFVRHFSLGCNALKLSGLPHHKTLDQFDFAFQPGLDARKIKDRRSGFVRPGPAYGIGRQGSAKPCSPSR